jgi:hypothetical protein
MGAWSGGKMAQSLRKNKRFAIMRLGLSECFDLETKTPAWRHKNGVPVGEDWGSSNRRDLVRLFHGFNAAIGYEPRHGNHNIQRERNPWAHEGQGNCQHIDQQRHPAFQIFADGACQL